MEFQYIKKYEINRGYQMDVRLKSFLQDKLSFNEGSGEGKIMELSSAVSRFIRPGMSIQFGNGMTTPTAIFLKSPVSIGVKIRRLLSSEYPAAPIIWPFLRMENYAKK